MSRTGLSDPLRPRPARGARLTLTDPWGECDLLWRNPALKGFPLLDTALDGWYGSRPLDGAMLDGADFGGAEEARRTAARLLLFYGLRPNAPATDPVARFSLSGVLVKPAGRGPWQGTRRVRITLGSEGGYEPKRYGSSTQDSGYKPKTTARAAFRTLALIAGEVDSSRPDRYSARPLYLAFQLDGIGVPCGGYRAVITEPAP